VAVEAKICGLTRPEDAALAARLGATWLGVVFAASPRQVTVARAREIVEAASGCPVIGVFVSHTVDAILEAHAGAGLAAVQLHGGYDRAGRARLRADGVRIWQVRHVGSEDDVAGLRAGSADADVVLVEPRVAGAPGGTGVALDLDLARKSRDALAGCRMALAGGLRPETLGRAIALVCPDIVDVSSGVETVPGIKDPERLARFLEVARDA
jgi:phosphoribosylanthranilate isomerase